MKMMKTTDFIPIIYSLITRTRRPYEIIGHQELCLDNYPNILILGTSLSNPFLLMSQYIGF